MKFYCLVCRAERDSADEGEPIFRNLEAAVAGQPAAFCPGHTLQDCWAANRAWQDERREERKAWRAKNKVKLSRPKTAPDWWGRPNTNIRRRAMELERRIPKRAWAEMAMHLLAIRTGEYDTTIEQPETLMDLAVEELRTLAENGLI